MSETDLDTRPPRLGVTITAVAATIAFLASVVGHPAGIAIVAVGAVLLVGGTAFAVRSALLWGVVGAFLGFLFQASFGAGPTAPLVGLAAAVVAWDVGDHAIGLGEQVGRAARSHHAVLAHAAMSGIVATLVLAIGAGIYRVAPGNRPFSALFFLLVAVILLPIALRE